MRLQLIPTGLQMLLLSLLAWQDTCGLNFTLLLSMPNTSVAFSTGRVAAGALIAIDEVNRRPDLLAGHHIGYVYMDDCCDAVNGTGRIISLQRQHNFSAFIGPSCSTVCSLTARLAAYWNIVVVSPVCAGQEFLEKKEFPTLTRVFGPFTKMGLFFVRICQNFNWKRIGIIYNSHPSWNIPAEGIRFAAENNSITVAKYVEFYDTSHQENSSFSPAELLQGVAKVSRIIVISARGEMVRRFLIEAFRQGLINGEFVFFCFEPYKEKKIFGDFAWETGEADDKIAKEAFRALFLLTLYKPRNERYNNFSLSVIQRSREDFGYMYAPNEKVSVLAAITHDSVWLYAQALHETLAENGDPYDGLSLTRRMWNRTITGIQGDVTIDGNGDRESSYMMYHIQNSRGEFQVVANYYGTNKMYEQVEGVEIQWPGGRKTPPLDSPECGFNGELCPQTERSMIVAMGLIASLVATAMVAITLIYRTKAPMSPLLSDNQKKKYKLQKVESMMLWKISYNDVTVTEPRSSSSNSILDGMTIAGEMNITNGEWTSSTAASYRENLCWMRCLQIKSINLTSGLLTELQQCRELSHSNICSFVGASLEAPHLFLLTEFGAKGSLQDILRNPSIRLDWMFKYCLMLDMVKGMDYLHRSPLRSHGHLSSSNCVVDGRFVLKISDFGLSALRRSLVPGKEADQDHWHKLLWRAPELLRAKMPPNGTQKGDVYSFGIIIQEVVYRQEVFYIPSCSLKAKDIVERVAAGGCSPLRPHADRADCPEAVQALMCSCWSERPGDRPDFCSLKVLLKRLSPSGGSDSILDDLLSRLEQYATNLEDVVQERTAQLLEEKKKAESLLTQMLPRSVAAQLIAGNMVQAETYDCVTIYLSDIEGFTAISSRITPMQVVELLNELYTRFDQIIDNHDVYKVETIGDAYMVVSGLPIRNGDGHAKEIARMSLAVLTAMKHFQNKHIPTEELKVRIGLHSGPCVAGVVGLKMPRYCLFGDTVNTASRMESNGYPLRIHVSSATKALLDQFGTFQVELRGDIHMKGKGPVRTYWLLGEEG